MSDASYAAFLSSPEVWRLFFPPGFVSPGEKNPNYVAPNHGPMLSSLAVLNIVLSTIVVLSRLASRLFVVRSFKLDDWLIIPAFLSHLASCGLIIWAVNASGLGKHVYDCTPVEIANWYRTQYGAQITQLTGLFIARMSILVFLISLAGNAEPRSRYALIGVLAANAILWPASMLPAIFMCAPEFEDWSLLRLVSSGCMADAGKVVAVQKNSVAMGIFGVVLDFAILVIPIRLVWQLRLPVRQRIIVSGLFAVGSLACVAAVCKAVYTSRQLSENSNTFDLSYTFVPIFVSAIFEQTLGLVTACGPGLKPLFSHAFPLLVSTLRGGSRSKLTGGDPSSGYSGDGKGSGAVSKGTIGGSGKKPKVGKYDMDSIAMTTVDSRSSIIERGDAESREEGGYEEGREGAWKGSPV